MNTSEVLNAAADDLEVYGWQRGADGMNPEGPHCALGSIGHVIAAPTFASSDGTPRHNYASVMVHPAAIAFADHLGVEAGVVGQGIFGWNDYSYRTAEQVVEALRACAILEAAKESADVRESVSSCS